jgi:hypothetical protein
LENSRRPILKTRGAEPGRPAILAAPEVTGVGENTRNPALSGYEWAGMAYLSELPGTIAAQTKGVRYPATSAYRNPPGRQERFRNAGLELLTSRPYKRRAFENTYR